MMMQRHHNHWLFIKSSSASLQETLQEHLQTGNTYNWELPQTTTLPTPPCSTAGQAQDPAVETGGGFLSHKQTPLWFCLPIEFWTTRVLFFKHAPAALHEQEVI